MWRRQPDDEEDEPLRNGLYRGIRNPSIWAVLDSNQIVPDFLFQNLESLRFLEILHFADCGLCVPAPVVAEVERKYRESIDLARGALATLRRVIDPRITPAELDERSQLYSESLLTTLSDYSTYLPWYPDTTHADVVSRMHAGLRPFRGGEKPEVGYRDYLLWRTVVDLLHKDRKARVVLVTDNNRDFCQQGNPTGLHADLMGELETEEISPDRIEILPSKARLRERLVGRADRTTREFIEANPSWRRDFAREKLPQMVNELWNQPGQTYEDEPGPRIHCMKDIGFRITRIESAGKGYRIAGVALYSPEWHYGDPENVHADNLADSGITVSLDRNLRTTRVEIDGTCVPAELSG